MSTCGNVVAGVRCAGRGRKTWYEYVKDDLKLSLVCTLNGQCSGICGRASFWEERLTLAERGKIAVFKINDDDDMIYNNTKIYWSGDDDYDLLNHA